MAISFASLWQSWRRSSRNQRNRPGQPRGGHAPEALEDRTVPSAGMPDPAFGTNSAGVFDGSGKVITPVPSTNFDQGNAVALQADGKTVVAGAFRQTSTGVWDLGALRYNRN